MVDERIGRLVDLFGDDTVTFIVSDHGSKGMIGAFCVNQWLEQEGYITFKTKPTKMTDIDKSDIDWSRTKAWGWGGYYARIFFNVKGREPNGVIAKEDLEKAKRELTYKIMSIKDNNGRQMKNVVFEPDKLYGTAIGDKPDLMVYFDDLNWRSAGTVGHDSLYLFENDTGPDDSVHSMMGIFLMYNPKKNMNSKTLKGAKVEDIAPTILKMLESGPSDNGMDGKILPEVVAEV
jgi:predicted AlkP superfamily phosphohydrolase/phosphomutase